MELERVEVNSTLRDNKLLMLDSYHRHTIPKYKSPMIGVALPLSLIQYDIDIDQSQHMYGVNIRNYFNTQVFHISYSSL